MFDPETTSYLESGCALIVGTVAPDGEPFATRAWGLTVLSQSDAPEVRLLLDADDAAAFDDVRTTGAIAITAANVPTLRSMQLKGQILGLEPATDDDRARAKRFCREFFDDIVETEHTRRELVERLEPDDYIACVVRIDERFEQTPGPAAGTAIET